MHGNSCWAGRITLLKCDGEGTMFHHSVEFIVVNISPYVMRSSCCCRRARFILRLVEHMTDRSRSQYSHIRDVPDVSVERAR